MRTSKIMTASILDVVMVAGGLILGISPKALGQGDGTGMMMLAQPDSPAILIETNHTTTDLLQSAKLMNVSEHSVTGYRIGWVVVYPSGRSKVGLGLAIDVPAGIKPGEVANVPAQAVSLDFVKEGASAVFFFVTDVYSTGVPAWKPELVKVEQKAREMERPDHGAR